MPYHSSNPTTQPIYDTGSSEIISDIVEETTVNPISVIYNERFYYTQGEDFQFEGLPYIGYLNIDNDGNAYKSRYDKTFILNPVNNITNDLIFSGKFFDKSIYDKISIDFNLDDLLFKPNEIINKNSINYKLERLYDNFLTAIRNTNISDPLIPNEFNAYIALSCNASNAAPQFGVNTFFKVISSTTQYTSAGALTPAIYPALSNFDSTLKDTDSVSIEVISNKKDSDLSTLFMSSSSKIFAFKIDRQNTLFTLQASLSNVGTTNNTITFQNITSITSNGNDLLFINDMNNNLIHKLDVSTIVNEDRTGLRNFNHLDSVGGIGNFDTNFNRNDQIVYGNNNLYVYNSGTKSIKKFSENFEFQVEYFNNKFFNLHEFKSMTYNKKHNQLFVLCKDYNVLVLNGDNLSFLDTYEFNKNKFNIEAAFLTDASGVYFELPRKIAFSTVDSNIYYLITSQNIYKYFLSTQNKLINKFTIINDFDRSTQWNTIFTEWSAYEVTWNNVAQEGEFRFGNNSLTILENNELKEETLLAMANTRIFKYKETNDLTTLLADQRPTFFNKNQIFVSGNDYFNNITFNNSIYKILYNINLLSSLFSATINAIYDDEGLLYFDKLNNLSTLDKQDLLIEDLKQFFIGVNEPLTGNSLNRIITNLHDQLLRVLRKTEVNTSGVRIPALSTIVI